MLGIDLGLFVFILFSLPKLGIFLEVDSFTLASLMIYHSVSQCHRKNKWQNTEKDLFKGCYGSSDYQLA